MYCFSPDVQNTKINMYIGGKTSWLVQNFVKNEIIVRLPVEGIQCLNLTVTGKERYYSVSNFIYLDLGCGIGILRHQLAY